MKTPQEIAQLAQRALLYEVSCYPKPGLVDPIDHKTHMDMDFFTFIDSSVVLLPFFEQFVRVGATFNQADLTSLMTQIRPLGIQAEEAMRQATKGVNTHKGAIFSLGILLSATGYLQQKDALSATALSQTVQKMLAGLVKNDFKTLHQKSPAQLTNGEKMYLKYGLVGIRGEAQAGYPTIFEAAYPYLRKQTGDWNTRLLNTLMKIISVSEDSNLVKRSGRLQTLKDVQAQATAIVAAGGVKTSIGQEGLLKLDQEATQGHYSLGGSADLLIITVYVTLLLQ